MTLVICAVLEISASSALHDHLHSRRLPVPFPSLSISYASTVILYFVIPFVSTVMSSINSGESDGYVTCGSRASSIHHYVHWAPQHESDHQGQSSSHPEQNPTEAATSDALGTDGSQSSICRHLISRLKLGGFRMDPTLPAVFQADDPATTRNNIRGWEDKQEGLRKEGSSDTVLEHGQTYICGLREDIFQNLMDHIHQLLARHLSSSGHSSIVTSNQSSTPRTKAKAVYKIPDKDLREVIRHVVRIMETLHHASILGDRSQDWPVEASSTRRTSLTNAITPRSFKKEAETATTIRVPRPYITPVISLEDIPAKIEPPLVSTTDPVTGNVHGEDALLSTSKLSGPGGSSENRRRTGPTIKSASEAHCRRTSSHNSSESQIVSFPTLTKRQCTNDWLIPPAATPGPKEPTKADLYALGIDAHTGPSAYFVPPSNNPQQLLTPAVEALEFKFRTPSYAEAVEEEPTLDEPRHLGSSIGSAAGRKMSVSPALTSEPGSRRGSLFWKFGRNSVRLSNGTGSAAASASAGLSRQPSQTHLHREGRRSSSVELMRSILHRAPPPTPTSDRRGTVSHVQSHVGQKRPSLWPANTCSEDGRPHLCTEDEFRFSSYALAREAS